MLPRESLYQPERRDARLKALLLAVFLAGLVAIGAAWIATGKVPP